MTLRGMESDCERIYRIADGLNDRMKKQGALEGRSGDYPGSGY